MERLNGCCLRAKPEFIHFSAMSLEFSKIVKPGAMKKTIRPGYLFLRDNSVHLLRALMHEFARDWQAIIRPALKLKNLLDPSSI